jgi:pimeloyl-ACP methyl ester carboxylesterase
MIRIRSVLAVALVALTVVDNVESQSTPITIGESVSIPASILGESRPLRIYLPLSYADSLDRYPVIYVLDGETNFMPTLSTMQVLATGIATPELPEAIVVAVHNTHRERDLRTPTLDGDHGGKRFADFIADELIPYVTETYRTNPLRILIGHSQGGSFATYVLATRPDTFRFYLTIDPPLHLTPGLEERVIEVLSEPGNAQRLVTCELALGWGDAFSRLEEASAPNAHVERVEISDASHVTMFIPSVFAGLRRLFHDYVFDADAADLDQLGAHYETLSRAFGYDVRPPRGALSETAFMQTLKGHGHAALEIYARIDALYGASGGGGDEAMMRRQAQALADAGPDRDWSELFGLLELPPPTPEQMAPYLGEWHGELTVTAGISPDLTVTFSVEDGIVVTRTRHAFPGGRAMEGQPAFVLVEGDELRWGSKDRSGGIDLTTVRLAHGELTGEAELMGIVPPPEFAAFMAASKVALRRD